MTSVSGLTAQVTARAYAGGVSPSPYTLNLCPNPSFEVDLTGYTALAGTTLSQDTTQGFAGRSSMHVETDGSVSGEGFYTPEVPGPFTGTGSMSLYIMGETGSLTVSAVSGLTSTIIASTNVILRGKDYVRVVLPGLPLTAHQNMYLIVQTTTAQALRFWVDAVQYEMDSIPHPYIDGSYTNCAWTGPANGSSSYQLFQFMTSAVGGLLLSGRASPVTEGEIFQTSASGGMLLSGKVLGTTVVNPVAALSQFGIWTPADMDPALSYAGWSNAGKSTGQTGWNTVYGMFYPPQQVVASAGQVLWNRAAYAAVGFDFKAVTATWQESLCDVKVEEMPVVPGTSPVPTAYTPPRQISTIIKPTRLNFCPNPGIEVSAAGWVPIGSAVVSQDSSRSVVGTSSLKVAVHASGDGCYIAIPDLIVGDTYTVSASTQGGPGLIDVTMSCSGASASSSQDGIPYGGNAIESIGYGQGPYGGIEASTADMPTGQWFAPNCTFVARHSTVTLAFQSIPGTDVSYPTEFWVDTVLVEAADTVGTYFDGSFGTDYSWEGGGTAGLTRSYYYDRLEVAGGAVATTLSQHTPLGITAAAPVFSSPYSQ